MYYIPHSHRRGGPLSLSQMRDSRAASKGRALPRKSIYDACRAITTIKMRQLRRAHYYMYSARARHKRTPAALVCQNTRRSRCVVVVESRASTPLELRQTLCRFYAIVYLQKERKKEKIIFKLLKLENKLRRGRDIRQINNNFKLSDSAERGYGITH